MYNTDFIAKEGETIIATGNNGSLVLWLDGDPQGYRYEAIVKENRREKFTHLSDAIAHLVDCGADAFVWERTNLPRS